MHHVHHHHFHAHRLDRKAKGRGRGPGRDLEARIAFLEERQRDFEQAAADIASKIQWLRDRDAQQRAKQAAAGEATGPVETA